VLIPPTIAIALWSRDGRVAMPNGSTRNGFAEPREVKRETLL